MDDAFATIRHAGYELRHYASQRTAFYRARRAAALERFGLAVREAINASDDFEPVLVAIFDALSPRSDPF